MKIWRRRIVQALLLILAGILVAAVVLYLRVKDVPRFYDKALVTSLKQLDDSRDELLEKVEQLKQDVRFSPAYQITLTDEQLNGWLARKYDTDSKSAVFSRPRLAVHPGFIEIACRARYKSLQTVVSVRVTAEMTGRRNVGQVQITSIKAGSMSIGWDHVIDRVRQAVERTELETSWRSGDGEATVEVVIPSRWRQSHRELVIESIELAEGQLMIRGRSE